MVFWWTWGVLPKLFFLKPLFVVLPFFSALGERPWNLFTFETPWFFTRLPPSPLGGARGGTAADPSFQPPGAATAESGRSVGKREAGGLLWEWGVVALMDGFSFFNF